MTFFAHVKLSTLDYPSRLPSLQSINSSVTAIKGTTMLPIT